ncbi:hypothetical protein ACYSNM_07910 [Myroides sp. LJL116]
MKKLLTLSALLFVCVFAFGQEEITLEDKYILQANQLRNGSQSLEILELVNSSLYWVVWDKINIRGMRPSVEDYRKSLENIKFTPKEGKYYLKNNYQNFWFTIDQDGQFTDTAYFENSEQGQKEIWNLEFENGNVSAVSVTLEGDDNPSTKIEANDERSVIQDFNPKSGSIITQRIIKKGGDWHNSVVSEYYENGNIKVERDGENKSEKMFYENGILRSYTQTITREAIDYDEQGVKTYHSYPFEENSWCREYYSEGLIRKKECTNRIQDIEYYYTNGKLDYYEVQDNQEQERRKYDHNNKLISTEKLHYTNTY